MGLLPYKYFVHSVKDGKVINSEFCRTLDEVKVFRAIASSKGQGFEIFDIDSGSKKPEESTQQVSQEPMKQKIEWEKKVKCIETGKIYVSIRQCSRDTGINYRSLINSLRYDTPRKGLHFVYVTSSSVKVPKSKKCNVGKWTRKYYCVTTNQTFNSASECMAFCGVPVTSFFRALKRGVPVNGLLFKKL